MAAKKGKRKPTAKRRTVVVVGKRRTHHKPKKRSTRSVGATHHKRPKTRKKRSGMLGSTGRVGLKQIGWMALGVGTGAAITHIVLRPVERRLAEKWPMIGKFIAAGEVFLGGMIALKGKKDFVRSVGVGILAGGVHGLMKQANIYKNIPGISGGDGYSEVRVPISGSLDHMMAGILSDGRREVRTSVVAGTEHTDIVAGDIYRTKVVAGDVEDDVAWYTKGGL